MASGNEGAKAGQADLVVQAVQMKIGLEVATVKQVVDAEHGTLEMGVFRDGVGFMSRRALARFCGVDPADIRTWPEKFEDLKQTRIGELLVERGFQGETLFAKVYNGGSEINAYPEIVCMVMLEYYAFEAPTPSGAALKMFRNLAGVTLREFIYKATGYDPNQQAALAWQVFHDRLLLNKVPTGFFSIFGAMADFALDMIRHGLEYDDETIPDISVGQMWARFWAENKLEDKYGSRIKYGHVYPDYYRQSAANEWIEAYIYPVAALGEFKKWLDMSYVTRHFPNYLKRKETQGKIESARAVALIAAVEPRFLT